MFSLVYCFAEDLRDNFAYFIFGKQTFELDRDRDRMLHPVQVKSLFTKYKVSKVIP
jgi:hypothetical protein